MVTIVSVKKCFEKEWNKCKIPGRKRKQWKWCVHTVIISDIDLTSSLESKEALSCIMMHLRILS